MFFLSFVVIFFIYTLKYVSIYFLNRGILCFRYFVFKITISLWNSSWALVGLVDFKYSVNSYLLMQIGKGSSLNKTLAISKAFIIYLLFSKNFISSSESFISLPFCSCAAFAYVSRCKKLLNSFAVLTSPILKILIYVGKARATNSFSEGGFSSTIPLVYNLLLALFRYNYFFFTHRKSTSPFSKTFLTF